MLGWEFPPFISGGVGVACYGLTRAMSRVGHRVLFVLPGPTSLGFSAESVAEPGQTGEPAVRMSGFDNVEFRGIGTRFGGAYGRGSPLPSDVTRAPLRPRAADTADPPLGRWPTCRPAVAAPSDPLDDARRFADLADDLAATESAHGRRFAVVHAHDWLTLPAAQRVAHRLAVPIVAHVHSTEHERHGERADPRIIDAECRGLQAAHRVVAVSRATATVLIERYALDANRITVVHNAPDDGAIGGPGRERVAAGEKIVAFLGRLVPQKNPGALLDAARSVLEQEPAARFVLAGGGELERPLRDAAEAMGIDRRVLFAGDLRGEDVERLYAAADVVVMPGKSEPFGLVAVEAARRGVPVILDESAGAGEVLEHAVKLDAGDPAALAGAILAVLSDPDAAAKLGERGAMDVSRTTWPDAADRVGAVYDDLLPRGDDHTDPT
jgi:glycosyltransferase involved in cell wall biosynthesis